MISEVAAVVEKVVEAAQKVEKIGKAVENITAEKDSDWGGSNLKNGIKAGGEKIKDSMNSYLHNLDKDKTEAAEDSYNIPELREDNKGGEEYKHEEYKHEEYKHDPIEESLTKYLDKLETQEEKIEKQDKAIDEVDKGDKNLDSTQEKGNYGEMRTDQDLRDKGYERISTDMVTDVDDSGHQGIDGVYYNPDGTPQYIIADSKYGTAQLSDTLDGKQMSSNWIDKRLDESVGKEKADEIRMEKLLNPDNVGSYVAHVDEQGNVVYDKLDDAANTIEKEVKINE